LDDTRLLSLMEALLVTFLWSSSYILVKIGLTQLPPLTLAALRYIVASAILISFALAKGRADILEDRKTLLKLASLGLTGYTIAQGLQVLGLFYLPAVSVTFILNFNPVMVLVLSVLFLGEYPTRLQLAGMALVLVGAYMFFNAPLSAQSLTGVLITLLSGVGWAAYLVACRLFFVREEMEPLGLTAFSMGSGSLLITAAALAFFLWNHALQRL